MAQATYLVVYHSDMHKTKPDHHHLLINTAKALDGQVLQLLLWSVQWNDVEFSIEQVIKE
jgi:hypothetical protein